MKFSEYMAGISGAKTVDELEAAIQAPYTHKFHGPTWTRISKARIARGIELCAAHTHGHLVPQMHGRKLTVCGQTYGVGRGYNSAGVRYAWAGAWSFAKRVLMDHGLTQRAAHMVWDQWATYPHRCIQTIEKSFRGEMPDPVMNTLILAYSSGNPISLSVEANDADGVDRRATMACQCGGTLFDWGCGTSHDFTFINWHCNACPKVFTEYVTQERFAQIRPPRWVSAVTEQPALAAA